MPFEPKPIEFLITFGPVLTQAEAAIYLSKSVKALQRRRKAKQISYIRDGGILYEKKDLDAFLADRRVAETAPPPPERKTKYQETGARSASNSAALLDII